MFQLYANLLSVDAVYMWNKIVQDQTTDNPYTDLQGLTRKGPRGLSRMSFDDCVMFHHLTVFSNSAAEQERYLVMNVLKKPHSTSICQFVHCVEQLNSYILQLPCWFYRPSVKATMTPMNMSFTEADLASHVLQMCPCTWQDQFNLHEKDMTPVVMCLLLSSLEAIERVCNQERCNTSPTENALHSKKKGGSKRPGTDTTAPGFSPNVPIHMARSVQPSQEMYDSHGCICFSCLSRLLSKYVTRKDPMLLLAGINNTSCWWLACRGWPEMYFLLPADCCLLHLPFPTLLLLSSYCVQIQHFSFVTVCRLRNILWQKCSICTKAQGTAYDWRFDNSHDRLYLGPKG